MSVMNDIQTASQGLTMLDYAVMGTLYSSGAAFLVYAISEQCRNY